MKFIILGNNYTWLKWCLSDAKKYKNIVFYDKYNPIKNAIWNCFTRIVLSSRFHFPKAVKEYAYTRYFLEYSKDRDERIIFIIYDQNRFANDIVFLKKAKKYFRNLCLVYAFTNIVKCSGAFSNGFTQELKHYYDLIYAFDEGDVKHYSFEWMPLIYSKNTIKHKPQKRCVFFAGEAKDRLPKLIRTYEVLSSIGVDCDFHILGVSKDEMKYPDKIKYNHRIPYSEVLKRIQESSCIIEYRQGGSEAFTIKACEAIFYNKIFITSNEKLLHTDFYDRRFMHYIESPEEITIDFFKNDDCVSYNESARYYFSLERFLKMICEKNSEELCLIGGDK